MLYRTACHGQRLARWEDEGRRATASLANVTDSVRQNKQKRIVALLALGSDVRRYNAFIAPVSGKLLVGTSKKKSLKVVCHLALATWSS